MKKTRVLMLMIMVMTLTSCNVVVVLTFGNIMTMVGIIALLAAVVYYKIKYRKHAA